MNLELLAVIYSLFTASMLPSIVPLVYEPLSRRPEALRATWALASLLPLTPLSPPVAVPAAIASAALAWRGRRVAATLLAYLTTLVISLKNAGLLHHVAFYVA